MVRGTAEDQFRARARRALEAGEPFIGRGAKSKQFGVIVAATVLVTFTAVKIGYELMNKEPSIYDMMDVLPSAGAVDLKKGYKRSALKYHPDKACRIFRVTLASGYFWFRDIGPLC